MGNFFRVDLSVTPFKDYSDAHNCIDELALKTNDTWEVVKYEGGFVYVKCDNKPEDHPYFHLYWQELHGMRPPHMSNHDLPVTSALEVTSDAEWEKAFRQVVMLNYIAVGVFAVILLAGCGLSWYLGYNIIQALTK